KTKTGWNKMAVRQCLEHGVSTSTGTGDGNYTENGSLRQDQKGQDISTLFSSVMLVTVKNELINPDPDPDPTPETGSLTITKQVTSGDAGSAAFEIQVSLKDAGGNPLTGSYSYNGDKSGTISNGGTISLQSGQSVTITG